MNTRMQIVCAWAGPAFIVLFAPVAYSMGLIPVPSPDLPTIEVAARYRDNQQTMIAGGAIIMSLGMIGIPFTTALAAQLRRIETSRSPIYTYSALVLGALIYFLFIFPGLFFMAAAYRPDRNPELIALLHDLALLSLFAPIFVAVLQAFVVGTLILSDQRDDPIFPRWFAYLNYWSGVLFLPGPVVGFFHHGPFAWSGLFVAYVPLAVFNVQIYITAWLITKAALRQAREETGALYANR